MPVAARTVAYADTLHGVEVTDPWRWMEDTTTAATSAWISAQEQYTDAVLSRLVGTDTLRSLIGKALEGAPSLDGVFPAGGRTFLLRWFGPAPSIFALDSGSTTERLLLSADSLSRELNGARIRAISPSWDGGRIAVGTTERGDANGAIILLDGATGKRLPDRIPDLLTTTSGTRYEVTWLPDGSGFFYPGLWPGSAKGPAADRLARGRQFLHRLGTPQSSDIAIFGFGVSDDVVLEAGDLPTRIFTALGSSWLVGAIFRSKQNGTDFWAGTLTTDAVPAWRQIATVEDRIALPQLHGDTVYALSRKDADRGTLVRRVLHPDRALGPWETVLPEQQGVIVSFSVQQEGIYLSLRQRGALSLVRLPYGDSVARPIPLPATGTVRLDRRNPGAAGISFSVESWATPPDWLRATGDSANPMPIDDGSDKAGAEIVSERLEAKSRDGTLVPVSLVYGRSSTGKPPANAPLLIDAYGGFGVSTDPSYNPFYGAWVALGGIYAYAHVRGGGELGEAWHQGATREKKQNSVDDMIGAIETLIDRGYTAPGRVILIGTSFGANIPGLLMVQRPELLGAALYEVGQPDEIRGSSLDPTAARNIAELGDLDTPEGVRLLLNSSPYHRVPTKVKLPAIIVHSAAGDYNFGTQMLPAKYVARLQAANSGDRPVLWVQTPEGHQALFGVSPEWASKALSFVLWQAGDPRFQPPAP